MVYEATDQTFDELIQGSYVAVDFYGTHCGPCRALEPIYNEMSNDLAMLRFVKVNVDQCPELQKRFQIYAVPTLKYFRDGKLFYEGKHHGDRAIMDREIAKLLYD